MLTGTGFIIYASSWLVSGGDLKKSKNFLRLLGLVKRVFMYQNQVGKKCERSHIKERSVFQE